MHQRLEVATIDAGGLRRIHSSGSLPALLVVKQDRRLSISVADCNRRDLSQRKDRWNGPSALERKNGCLTIQRLCCGTAVA
jgi:hypothetical protein